MSPSKLAAASLAENPLEGKVTSEQDSRVGQREYIRVVDDDRTILVIDLEDVWCESSNNLAEACTLGRLMEMDEDIHGGDTLRVDTRDGPDDIGDQGVVHSSVRKEGRILDDIGRSVESSPVRGVAESAEGTNGGSRSGRFCRNECPCRHDSAGLSTEELILWAGCEERGVQDLGDCSCAKALAAMVLFEYSYHRRRCPFSHSLR
jgi:hypothetical protein